jgi:hypothetical protein
MPLAMQNNTYISIPHDVGTIWHTSKILEINATPNVPSHWAYSQFCPDQAASRDHEIAFIPILVHLLSELWCHYGGSPCELFSQPCRCP